MKKFKVWINPIYNKRSSEEESDEIEAEDVYDAVKKFAAARYSELGHIDPGHVCVRSDNGFLSYWKIEAYIGFYASPDYTSPEGPRDHTRRSSDFLSNTEKK